METLTQPSGLDLAALSSRYVAMLEASEIPDPLRQPIAVAAVLLDLCQLAGVPAPDYLVAALERIQ